MTEHLSEIPTLWTVVRHAHDEDVEIRRDAQSTLLERYGNAIRRYLLASLRDAELADELMQEFSLRFVRGDFKNVDPSRGQFRSYVKSVVFRLVMDHHRRRGRKHAAGPLDFDAAAPDVSMSREDDELFLKSWRDDLLDRAWKSLAESDAQTGQASHAILKARVDSPELKSDQLAHLVASETGRDVGPDSVRVLVHRAREKFAATLLQAVIDSLDSPSNETLEAELIDLKLIAYCKPALEKRRQTAAPPQN